MAKALTKDEVMNRLWHYSNRFDVWEVRLDLIEILERHGHDKYYIYIEKFVNLKAIFYLQKKNVIQLKFQVNMNILY